MLEPEPAFQPLQPAQGTWPLNFFPPLQPQQQDEGIMSEQTLATELNNIDYQLQGFVCPDDEVGFFLITQ